MNDAQFHDNEFEAYRDEIMEWLRPIVMQVLNGSRGLTTEMIETLAGCILTHPDEMAKFASWSKDAMSHLESMSKAQVREMEMLEDLEAMKD